MVVSQFLHTHSHSHTPKHVMECCIFQRARLHVQSDIAPPPPGWREGSIQLLVELKPQRYKYLEESVYIAAASLPHGIAIVGSVLGDGGAAPT